MTGQARRLEPGWPAGRTRVYGSESGKTPTARLYEGPLGPAAHPCAPWLDPAASEARACRRGRLSLLRIGRLGRLVRVSEEGMRCSGPCHAISKGGLRLGVQDAQVVQVDETTPPVKIESIGASGELRKSAPKTTRRFESSQDVPARRRILRRSSSSCGVGTVVR